jgi:hypothetical protein
MELGGTQRLSRMLLGDFTVMMLSKLGIYAHFRNLEPKYTADFCTLVDLAITLALYQCLRLRSSFRAEVLCGPRWWAGASAAGTWFLVCQKSMGKGGQSRCLHSAMSLTKSKIIPVALMNGSPIIVFTKTLGLVARSRDKNHCLKCDTVNGTGTQPRVLWLPQRCLLEQSLIE